MFEAKSEGRFLNEFLEIFDIFRHRDRDDRNDRRGVVAADSRDRRRRHDSPDDSGHRYRDDRRDRHRRDRHDRRDRNSERRRFNEPETPKFKGIFRTGICNQLSRKFFKMFLLHVNISGVSVGELLFKKSGNFLSNLIILFKT